MKGREQYLQNCKGSYAAHTEDYELIVVPDKKGCGEAWVAGADRAVGDYIHFSADDLCAHAGWSASGSSVCDFGFLPAPRILNTDGSLQSCGSWGHDAETGEQTFFTRIPFLSREQWRTIAPLVTDFLRESHYYTDNVISWAARREGIETGVHQGYLFTHHLAPADRTLEPGSRMQQDGQRFMALVSRTEGKRVAQVNDYGIVYA